MKIRSGRAGRVAVACLVLTLAAAGWAAYERHEDHARAARAASDARNPAPVILRGISGALTQAVLPPWKPGADKPGAWNPGYRIDLPQGVTLEPEVLPGSRTCEYGYQSTIDISCPSDGTGVLRVRITATADTTGHLKPGSLRTDMAGRQKTTPIIVIVT
ncbi:hypothetical protein ACIQUQ_27930 [Streptomyces sp. NPDC101118]|uniref:hypothetical protein n=1 Tax=Streptomyces sp. NPDC101118 TaxID=3366109 RepID=UPI0038214D95